MPVDVNDNEDMNTMISSMSTTMGVTAPIVTCQGLSLLFQGL